MTSSGLNANQCKHTASRCRRNLRCMGALENDINRVTQRDDGDRQTEARGGGGGGRIDVRKEMEKGKKDI